MHCVHGRISTFAIDGVGGLANLRSSRVPFYGGDMAFDGSLAYIANGVDGLMILDIDTECPPVCWADRDGDGDVDFFDVSAWIPAYLARERQADLDNNGLFNISDIDVLLDGIANGCP